MKKELIILIIILAIAAFLRLWRLDSVPPGLYPDEAIHGNQAISEPGKIFYPENNGREGFFINLIAVFFKIFGPSIFSLRLVSAVTGVLTVLGLYFLTKELFRTVNRKNEFVALLASFFLAISFWHINFSRIVFRAIFVPFLLVFTFYFLLKGFRNKKILNFIVAGFFFGLGFHTYIAFRIAVLLLAVFLFNWWLVYKKQGLEKKFLLFTFYFLISTFLIALPIGVYFLTNPADLIGRAGSVSIFAAKNPIKEFGKSLALHLGMFNFYGDPNWRHNFSGHPQLFLPIGILFLLGLFSSAKELSRLLKEKKLLSLVPYLSALGWFFIMLLPGILSRESLPHALRTIGVIPVCYIFAGLGGIKLHEAFIKNVKNKKLLIFACTLFLLSIFSYQFNKYFSSWAQNPKVKGAFSGDYVEVGNYLNSLPPEIKKYVIVNRPGVLVDGIPMPAQTIMFIENLKPEIPASAYLLPEDIEQIKINERGEIVLLGFDASVLVRLSRIPRIKIGKIANFWLFKIEKI